MITSRMDMMYFYKKHKIQKPDMHLESTNQMVQLNSELNRLR